MASQLPLLILGSTGALGRALIEAASPRPIRAFARHPEALAGHADNVEVVQGDALDPSTLRPAVSGVGAVVSTLGSRPGRSPSGLFSRSTRLLLEAMAAEGVSRLIVITGIGAGDSRGHGPFWYDHLVKPTVLREIYADKDRQEGIVAASTADWTIVRPGILTSRPSGAPLRAVTTLHRGDLIGGITREEVARYIVTLIDSNAHVRDTITVWTSRH